MIEKGKWLSLAVMIAAVAMDSVSHHDNSWKSILLRLPVAYLTGAGAVALFYKVKTK